MVTALFPPQARGKTHKVESNRAGGYGRVKIMDMRARLVHMGHIRSAEGMEAAVPAAPAGCGRPSGHQCGHADFRHQAISAAEHTHYTCPVAAVARLASGGGAPPPPRRQKRSLSLTPATAGLSTQEAARRRGQHGMRRRRRRDPWRPGRVPNQLPPRPTLLRRAQVRELSARAERECRWRSAGQR